MSLTWEQEVALCLVQRLLDPGLVHYFMGIMSPMRKEFVFQEAKEFHCSLRLTMDSRHKETSKKKERGEFHLMNPGVPITFPLPFNCREWRNMQINFTKIHLLVEGFMTTEIGLGQDRDEVADYDYGNREQSILEKLWTINKLISGSFVCNTFKEFETASKEFIDCMSDTEYGEMDTELELDYPNLLTMRGPSGDTMCVIVG